MLANFFAVLSQTDFFCGHFKGGWNKRENSQNWRPTKATSRNWTWASKRVRPSRSASGWAGRRTTKQQQHRRNSCKSYSPVHTEHQEEGWGRGQTTTCGWRPASTSSWGKSGRYHATSWRASAGPSCTGQHWWFILLFLTFFHVVVGTLGNVSPACSRSVRLRLPRPRGPTQRRPVGRFHRRRIQVSSLHDAAAMFGSISFHLFGSSLHCHPLSSLPPPQLQQRRCQVRLGAV